MTDKFEPRNLKKTFGKSVPRNSTQVDVLTVTFSASFESTIDVTGTATLGGTLAHEGTSLGFYSATPASQPASANQAALTNSTGGTADGTLTSVEGSADVDQPGVIDDNFTELHTLLNEIRSALVTLGIIKGSA